MIIANEVIGLKTYGTHPRTAVQERQTLRKGEPQVSVVTHPSDLAAALEPVLGWKACSSTGSTGSVALLFSAARHRRGAHLPRALFLRWSRTRLQPSRHTGRSGREPDRRQSWQAKRSTMEGACRQESSRGGRLSSNSCCAGARNRHPTTQHGRPTRPL